MRAGRDTSTATDTRIVIDMDYIPGSNVAKLDWADHDASLAVDTFGFINADYRRKLLHDKT